MPGASAGPAAVATTAAGQQLGRYRLVERLGQGCQGEVWKAIRLDHEPEAVALKVLPHVLARNAKRLAQFRREAERGARLVGPALLPTIDFGEADGCLFLAMPLVDGCSLSEVVAWRRGGGEAGPPPRLHRLAFATEADYLRGVTRILERVARSLAGVHAAGVAHRDIKPANILLDRRRDDAGFLCDFGLGRDLNIATPAQLRDGAGTPLYMAPERLLRRPADEIRSDIYALGATLFEAVTHVPPVQVPEDLPWPDWTSYLIMSRPPRPGAVREGVPEELEAIILRAMARQPAQRYPTAMAMADDLDRSLAGAPIHTRRPTRHAEPEGSHPERGNPA